MFYLKVTLLILLQLAAFGVKAQDTDVSDCYMKATDGSIDALKEDRITLNKYMKSEQAIIDGKSRQVSEFSFKIEAEAQLISKKAQDLEARAVQLDKETANVDKQFQEIEAHHEEFKKQMDGHTNTSGAERRERNNHMYKEAVVHHDMADAKKAGIWVKSGNARAFNENSYIKNLWHKRKMIRIGSQANTYLNGIRVNVPQGYNVLWLRCSNLHWGTFTATYISGGAKSLGIFSCGHRHLNEISPDGSAADTEWNAHKWMPIPLPLAFNGGHIYVHTARNADGWVSGIAFGKNLWGHARNSAVAYHWALNKGTGLGWTSHVWNNDNLANIHKGRVNVLTVPVYSNGKNKLVYCNEHNANWVGTMHKSVKVNDKSIERFRTSYTNPFATHFNSKAYNRYMAAFIPATFIPAGATHIKLEIDMTEQDNNILIRECGTHDYE